MAPTSEEHDVKRFSRWARTYEQSRLQRNFFNQVHQTVLQLIADTCEPESVLDVGCGTGHLLREMHQRWPNAKLQGVDAAEGMIEVARQLTPGATFQVARAEALPVPDASVDVVLSTVSFHHWTDQVAGLTEVARVLRPGGHFFLVDMVKPALLAPILRLPRVHTRTQLRALFARVGLEIGKQQSVTSRFVLATVSMRAGDY